VPPYPRTIFLDSRRRRAREAAVLLALAVVSFAVAVAIFFGIGALIAK